MKYEIRSGGMPRPEHVKCENCVYWERLIDSVEDSGEDGYCRRYPRRPFSEHKKMLALSHIYWAAATAAGIVEDDMLIANNELNPEGTEACSTETLGSDWCGEFRSSWPETA
jgi:hypothetical protein